MASTNRKEALLAFTLDWPVFIKQEGPLQPQTVPSIAASRFLEVRGVRVREPSNEARGLSSHS